MTTTTKARQKPAKETAGEAAERMIEEAQEKHVAEAKALVTDALILEHTGVHPHLDALILARHLYPHVPDQAIEAHRLLSQAIVADVQTRGRTSTVLVELLEALCSFVATFGLDFAKGHFEDAIPERDE